MHIHYTVPVGMNRFHFLENDIFLMTKIKRKTKRSFLENEKLRSLFLVLVRRFVNESRPFLLDNR